MKRVLIVLSVLTLMTIFAFAKWRWKDSRTELQETLIKTTDNQLRLLFSEIEARATSPGSTNADGLDGIVKSIVGREMDRKFGILRWCAGTNLYLRINPSLEMWQSSASNDEIAIYAPGSLMNLAGEAVIPAITYDFRIVHLPRTNRPSWRPLVLPTALTPYAIPKFRPPDVPPTVVGGCSR